MMLYLPTRFWTNTNKNNMCGDDLIGEVLEKKGYVHFASSKINGIYLEGGLYSENNFSYCARL